MVLSSVAAVRPRKANFVYGAAKAGLDAFARGLADSLHGSGVRVVLVRPGFVTGRMTAGMPPAPLATTPAKVGAATAAALRDGRSAVWIPARWLACPWRSGSSRVPPGAGSPGERRRSDLRATSRFWGCEGAGRGG